MANGGGRRSAELADHDVRGEAAAARARGKHRAPSRSRRLSPVVGLILGLLGIMAAAALPFAPVITNAVTVTWPKAGHAPESTLAFFVPYTPVEVHAWVPCPVVRAGQQDKPTTLVSTTLPGRPTEGFAVTTANDHVIVLVAGREALRAPVTTVDCSVTISSDAAGSSARIGTQVVGLPGERVTNIVAFATDLPPEQASGLRVSARTANPFENSPSPTKNTLMQAQLALVVLAIVLLALEDRRRRSPAPPLMRTGGRHRWSVDLAVAGVLGGWLVLGPNTPDDSFAATTVRNGLRTGDIGNYYRWENASEAPFTLVQHLLELVAAHSTAPLVLRIPSVVAGLLTWFLLSRGVVNAVLPAHGRRSGVRALAAVAFLTWWLPFGLGVRPEPFVALGTTAVLACVLRGLSRASLLWLGLAALAAGLCLAVNPVGVTALAPFLVLAPGIWRTIVGPGGVRATAVAWISLLTCLASTGVLAMFADQSLSGAGEATRLHGFYGPNVPWYQEIVRYQYLLGFDLQGSLGRRAPVLLTLTILIFTAALLARGARRFPGMRLTYVPGACFAISLGLLWVTPSKWTHYFGALAGVGAATLTAGVVLIAITARQWAKDRTVLLLGMLCTALTVVVAALVFAGKNNWFLHARYGVPWTALPVRPLNSSLAWLLLVGALLAASALVAATHRKRGDHSADDRSTGRMLIRMPAIVSTAAMGVTVTILLFSFVVAPLQQADSYSIGRQNLATLAGGSCGIVDHVVATPDIPGGVLRPSNGAEESVGFRRNIGYAPDNAPPAPAGTGSAEYLWGSLDGGQISTGSLTTGWFGLPELRESTEMAVSAAGRTGDGNRLALEFGSSADNEVRSLGERVLDDTHTDRDEWPTYPTDHVVEDEPQDNPAWRTLPVPAQDIPAGADRVRIRAVDGTTDPGGWLAVTGPRLREVIPLREYLREPETVLVDWSMTWAAPCLQDMPHVGGGLVEPPRYLLNPPNDLGFGGTAAYTRGIGGSFAGVPEVGEREEIPTRLLGVDDQPEYAEWGHLVAVSYPVRGNDFDVHSVPIARWGWRGEK